MLENFNKYNHLVLWKSTKDIQQSEKCPCFKNHWTSHIKSRNLWSSDPKASFISLTPPCWFCQAKEIHDDQELLCQCWGDSPNLERWAICTLSKAVNRNYNLRGGSLGKITSSASLRLYLWAGTAYSWLRLWCVRRTLKMAQALHTLLVDPRPECASIEDLKESSRN